MELYAGLDLDSRNTYIGTIANEFNQVLKKRLPIKAEHYLPSNTVVRFAGIIPDYIR